MELAAEEPPPGSSPRPLLGLRADANASDRNGDTALMLAVARGERLAISSLLEGRARVDMQNAQGRRAVDLTSDAGLRSLLEEESNRVAIARQLGYHWVCVR